MNARTIELAEQLLDVYRDQLVPGTVARSGWLDRDAVWLKVSTRSGYDFYLADASEHRVRPAFDHSAVAAHLRAHGIAAAPERVPVHGIQRVGAALRLQTLRADVWVDAGHGNPLSEQVQAASLRAVLSPDGRVDAYVQDGNLWLHTLGDDRREQLTFDGTPEVPYGTGPDASGSTTLQRRLGVTGQRALVQWSRDGKYLLTHRLHQKGVWELPLIESSPPGGARPRLHRHRYALPGDAALPTLDLVIIDVAQRQQVDLGITLTSAWKSPLACGRVWWGYDSTHVYVLDQPRDRRSMRLRRIDHQSGHCATVVDEAGETWLEPTPFKDQPPVVGVTPNGTRVVWFSERDGWGQLYLYDARSGQLLGRVTHGQYVVRDIVHLNDDRVLFTASGLASEDPYQRHLCTASLDGTTFEQLTMDNLDHQISAARVSTPSCLLDIASDPCTPPRASLTTPTGDELLTIAVSDAAPLLELGWRPPERVITLAADGQTEVHGLLYRPIGFDPKQRYPIVDSPYPGPQMSRNAPGFRQPPAFADSEALTALGLAVLALDGRGTPGRSKHFHTARLSDAGHLDDHVAALHQLAKTRPWLDVDRVAIIGASGGGYAAVRGATKHPNTYKVAVALCGVHDFRNYQASWAEMYDGLAPDRWTESSNLPLASQLGAKLLLVHGELDDNVPVQVTLRLVDALINHDRDFEMVIVPGADHGFVGYEHFVQRRCWQFLVRHLTEDEVDRDVYLRTFPTADRYLDQALGIT